jgi:hypothetical protein
MSVAAVDSTPCPHQGSRSGDSARSRYLHLLKLTHDRRQRLLDFSDYLQSETAYFIAPASTRYHLNVDGGLVEHSVNVAETLLRLRDALAPDLDRESCIICGVFHDLGKAGTPGQPYYVAVPPDRQRSDGRVRYVINPELVHMDVPTRSLFLLAQHVPLTNEEAQAIRYHDGQYIAENRSVAHRECRLTRLLQYADNWAAGTLESSGQAHP